MVLRITSRAKLARTSKPTTWSCGTRLCGSASQQTYCLTTTCWTSCLFWSLLSACELSGLLLYEPCLWPFSVLHGSVRSSLCLWLFKSAKMLQQSTQAQGFLDVWVVCSDCATLACFACLPTFGMGAHNHFVQGHPRHGFATQGAPCNGEDVVLQLSGSPLPVCSHHDSMPAGLLLDQGHANPQ